MSLVQTRPMKLFDCAILTASLTDIECLPSLRTVEDETALELPWFAPISLHNNTGSKNGLTSVHSDG